MKPTGGEVGGPSVGRPGRMTWGQVVYGKEREHQKKCTSSITA